MYFDFIFKRLFEFVAVAVIITLLWIVLRKARNNKIIRIRDASLTCEELEDHAAKIAIEHSIGKKRSLLNLPIARMNDNYNFILAVYKRVSEDVQKKRMISPAAEWLLDNFYIIEEQVGSIKKSLMKKEYIRLPILKSGALKGYARIYAVAVELISHTDGQIDENVLYKYLKAYQSHSVLLNREILALPAMIRLALIENIRNICERIKDTQFQWRKSDEIIDSWPEDENPDSERISRSVKNRFKVMNEINPSFIEHLFYRMRRMGHIYNHVLRYIDENLIRFGTTIEEIAQKEHNSQAVNAVSMGNCITSLKFISVSDWIDIFESTSSVEQILRQDPDGTYPAMDLNSRNYYRSRIEELAAIYGISELHIAIEAVKLAGDTFKKRNTDRPADGRLYHVGYYLTGKGIKSLEKKLGRKIKSIKRIPDFIKKYANTLYLGSIILITAILVFAAMYYSYQSSAGYRLLLTLLAGIAVFIPSSEIAVNLVNWIVCNIQKPAFFARLELKEGIPEDLSAVVVIPTLLPDEKRIKELLENLENFYLVNKGKNLYFALLGDFKDSVSRCMPEDEKITGIALEGIKGLNRKYALNGRDIFYFFQRHRTFNEKHKKWMGWERKRGALIEFNDMLLGHDDTCFLCLSSTEMPDLKIKFVITLDADTVLPIGTAKKMIGTIAHPLNRPVIDKNRRIVAEGYGLIQPRVSFGTENSNKSLFSRIFTGQMGIDPYTFAISDVYQDLFGEGIFTGKGIYDLKVFQKVLKNTIPENTILSHDLLEGSYLRTGLVTDLELMDSYPSKYNSYATRLHRWVRGDWQLIPWLGKEVPDLNGIPVKNPLGLISKWKILDNMRRSLVSPALVILVAFGFTVFPGSILFWLGFTAITALFPQITAFIDYISARRFNIKKTKRYIPVISSLQAKFLQIALLLVFLPYQAYLMVDAIVVTLVRVLITKKNMLEWVTAADVERGQKNSLGSYWAKMYVSVLAALAVIIPGFVFKPATGVYSLFLLLIWGISPDIAYRVSKTYKDIPPFKPSREDMEELRRIARKTWRYFEELANYKNHFLIPDNYQEDPPRGIALRTSPTNIGLSLLADLTARDLGYIGTFEMIDRISNTISTIERMEKWNGHLYNWYDIRTLRPLRPRYISTVDSGNLVCYYVTLMQGLGGYLESPVADARFIEGIKDTLSLAGKENSEIYKAIGYFNEIAGRESIDPVLWNSILNKFLNGATAFNSMKSPWMAKTDRMIKMFKNELQQFTPWVDMLETAPHELTADFSNEEAIKSASEILKLLNGNTGLNGLSDVYRNVLGYIEKAMAVIAENREQGTENRNEEKGDFVGADDPVRPFRVENREQETDAGKDIKSRKYTEGLDWLVGLKEEVARSKNNIEKFIERCNMLIMRIKALTDATLFLPLYAEKKQVFSVGYNIEENRLTNSYYDLFASEARQTSYIAIAKGEVPPKHWFKMDRALTAVDNYKGLVSWTGTMFEYLMPLIILKSYKNTLLDETYSFVIRSQIKYGRQRNIPWGVSESGFYSFDINLDYQYKAVGVPWLGLKRGLADDAVVAPYATFLALMVDPEAAVENIKKLKSEGSGGSYGFYEAMDYTPERLPFGIKRAVVKCFMAHHQGMSLLSLNNYLNDGIMQKRFHADPMIKAFQLLLQEKVPNNIVFKKEVREKVTPFKDMVYKERGPVRKFKLPDAALPRVHILSNGNYSVLVTDKGTGYSKNKMAAITRWREDGILDYYGMFFYVRNINTDSVWSAAFAPLYTLPDKYEVMFTADKARFKRLDGDMETETEIMVTSGDNAEIRRISFKNHGLVPYVLEVTSYFEVVLAPQAADIAHPAFSNLFVRTEFLPERKCLIANRRARSEAERSFWIANTVVVDGETIGDMQFETDRMQFIGRGRNITAPIAIDRNKPLSDSAGPVLDPVMCLRLRVKVEPGKKAVVSFITAVSESNETLLETIEKYTDPEAVERAFKLALTRSQVEARYLNIKAPEIELYQDMISHILFISPQRKMNHDIIAKNIKGQSSLWAYGISGDLPVVLMVLKKPDEIELLGDVLKAHEYWWIKDLKVDLVILNDEENSYSHPFQELLSDIVAYSHAHGAINSSGGIFLLNSGNMAEDDINLLFAVARFVLKGDGGTLSEQVKKAQGSQLLKPKKFNSEIRKYDPPHIKELKLDYFNGLGGFDPVLKEYAIRLGKGQNTPMPWVNVISNPEFGFLVSESGQGCVWCENSRENRLTPWSNDPVSDNPGEVFYINDPGTGELWSLTPLPIREDEPYTIRHGFGYSVFEHTSHGMEQSMIQFVPVDEPVKISKVNLKNLSKYARNLSLTYYIRPVLGVSDQFTAMHIRTRIDGTGAMLIENPYNEDFAGKIAFIGVPGMEYSITGDRKEFFGSGGISCPEALRRQKLSGTTGTGYDPCAAIQVNISLEENEEKEMVFLLGMCADQQQVNDLIDKYKENGKAQESLVKVGTFWKGKLDAIHVNTPDASMNIMMNGWLMYQVISCRMWARSSFYQSGGAFGFRDQLQDSLAVAGTWPEITRSQILLHARRQFIEGDVLHWWHEPQGKGTRTRFSDDLLWLPYITSEYIKVTGDREILGTELPFLEDEPLKEFEDEKYTKPIVSGISSSLYDHCIRAIEKSLKFGEHGLPVMGSGDWNDGMNTVGNRGGGESVWLAWFLYSVLMKFSPVCSKMGDDERAGRYAEIARNIANAVEKNAWDGSWYRRAYFDNGIPLGSVQNSECKIDSIAQTWAVISGAGNPQRVVEAVNSLENYLIRREDGLIKLLTPPFDEGDLEPGYIKGYVPGVRENGGQYTHAAAWVIIAFALLGDGNKAAELFELINPVNHTRTSIEYSKYKVEPYVMAADVYAVHPHIGRGGWTWYTGSAGWMYIAGLEYILGFRKNGNSINIDPCIPEKWTEYAIKYKYADSVYEINVKNPEGVSRGVKRVYVDGKALNGNDVQLINDGGTHFVEVYLGK